MLRQADINNRLNAQYSNGRELGYPPLPNRKYEIIYADPPWDYKGKLQYSRPPTKRERTAVATSAAIWQYPTVPTKELKNWEVPRIVADDALLFMWATSPFLDQAIDLGKAWGFAWSTVAFVWNKGIHNPGRYTLSECELCLLFKCGKIPQPRGARNIKQYVFCKREEHSKKPDVVRQRITEMFPTQKKIELFARNRGRGGGWHYWGLDC